MKFHPVAEIFPMMSNSELAQLAADIETNGLREPLWLHKDGRIIDGRNRYQACELAGISATHARTFEGDDSELVPFVVSLNLHRRHLNESQRAMVAARVATLGHGGDRKSDQAANLPVETQARAAEMLNVSERTVRNARKVQQAAAPELAQAVERGEVSVSAAAEVATEPENRQREVVAKGDKEILAAAKEIRERRKAQSMTALQSSENNEWYTPGEYVEAARDVMGSIDLDPASCPTANKTVRASRIFTAEDNGLATAWHGNVWLNPPYGRNDEHESNQGVWSARLIDQYENGEVDQAVLLVNAVTDRVWFRPLWGYAICFVGSRIKFYSPEGQKPQPTHGNVLVYLGPKVQAFARRFSEFGRVVVPRGWFSESV